MSAEIGSRSEQVQIQREVTNDETEQTTNDEIAGSSNEVVQVPLSWQNVHVPFT